MTFQIRLADLDSADDLRATADLSATIDLEVYGAVQRRAPQQQRGFMASTAYWDVRHHVAVDERSGALIGVGAVHLPLAENTDNLDFGIDVHPDWRGRGIGTALADRCAQDARDAGRTKITWWAFCPLTGDPDSMSVPANRIARRLGLERKNISILRRLDLPVAPELLAEITAEAAPYVEASGCRLVVWRGPIPDEYVDRYGPLLTQLELDEPDEDMDLEVQQFDAQRLQVLADRNAARGIESITAVVVAPDGSLAGNSELRYSTTPGTTLVEQESTLVMPAWRGHRFGLAMKAATHTMLADVLPEARACVTWNSHVNDQMIAINNRLGYRALLREIGYQTAT